MADMVRKIQGVTAKPLSIDTPDPEIARAGLAAYDPARAGGKKPILNSITPLRAGMFDLYAHAALPADPAGLGAGGRRPSKPCRTAEETYAAAQCLVGDVPATLPRQRPTTTASSIRASPPSAATAEGNLKRLIRRMELIHADPAWPACTPRWA